MSNDPAYAGLLDPVFQQYDRDVQDVSDTMSEDGIPAGTVRAATRAAGRTGQAIGTGVWDPLMGYVGKANDLARKASGLGPIYDLGSAALNKGLEHILSGVQDSAAFKYTMEKAEENPKVAGDLLAALHASDAVAARHVGGPAVNDFMDEVRTKLEGFYGGGTGGQLGAFGSGIIAGAPEWAKGQVSPQAIANRREKGTGATRVDEMLNAGSDSDKVGNTLASGFMAQQKGNTDSLAQLGPTYRSEVRTQTTFSDTQGVRDIIKGDNAAMPDDALDFFYRRLSTNADKTPPFVPKSGYQIKEGVGANMTNFGGGVNPQEAIIVGRNPTGGRSGTYLAQEAIGAKGQSSSVVSRIRDGSMEKHFKDQGIDAPTGQQYADYLNTVSIFERDSLADLNRALGRGDLRTTREKIAYEAKRKIDKRDEYKPERESLKSKAAYNQYQAAKKAEATGRELTPDQKQLIAWVDNERTKRNPVVYDKASNSLRYNYSYNSQAKDLGSVGGSMYVDLNDNQMYNMILDGHDMMGADPAGGKALWNVLPAQQTPFGSGRVEFGKQSQWEIDQKQAGVDALSERSGMVPYRKETAAEFEARAEAAGKPPRKTDGRKKEPIKDYADRVGMMYHATDESPFQFERRVFKDWDAPVQMQDYAQGMLNSVIYGTAAAPTYQEEQQ